MILQREAKGGVNSLGALDKQFTRGGNVQRLYRITLLGGRCNRSRLVANTRRRGQPASNSATSGAAAITCSKLSSSSKISFRRKNASNLLNGGLGLFSTKPKASPSLADATKAGSLTGARGTK
ncbi:MAG: hypothetical protein R3E79_25585 [Caldilineaceae bacterium]